MSELTSEEHFLIEVLKSGNQTKQSLQNQLGCGEREVREKISNIATKVPVIALSRKKGYRIAKDEKDLQEAIETRAETDSRIDKLVVRRNVLTKYINEMSGVEQ